MLGLKLLLGSIGGIAGVTGFASFAFQDWDPSHVWRLENKNEFYLFTCRQRSDENEINLGKRWIYSDLEVYLTFKENQPKIQDDTELKLIGRGYHEKLVGKKTENPMKYENSEDLHQTIANEQKDNRFSLSVGKTTGNNWLGEGGAGVESSTWGETIRCDKKLFTFEDIGTQRNDQSAELSRMKFSLYQCGQHNYQGIKGCLVKISDNGTNGAGHNGKLKWAENFQPIVISRSIS